jgi:hypothetical protein
VQKGPVKEQKPDKQHKWPEFLAVHCKKISRFKRLNQFMRIFYNGSPVWGIKKPINKKLKNSLMKGKNWAGAGMAKRVQ